MSRRRPRSALLIIDMINALDFPEGQAQAGYRFAEAPPRIENPSNTIHPASASTVGIWNLPDVPIVKLRAAKKISVHRTRLPSTIGHRDRCRVSSAMMLGISATGAVAKKKMRKSVWFMAIREAAQ
jgi:hypothetical protein